MNSKTYKNFTIHQFDELESTNKTAFDLASLGKIFDAEIILAKKQTGGKGRKDRNWHSPEGNLYFSLVLQPKIPIEKISQISLVAIVALKLAIIKITNGVAVKWPNDLLIEGKKVAGILLESKFNQKTCEFVILGIGVNIDSNPDNVIFPATNLRNFNIEISPQNLLMKFLDEFEKIYPSFLNYGFFGLRQLWLEDAYKLNEEITITMDEQKIKGIFTNLDEEGNLVLRCGDELLKIGVADVS